MKAVLALVAAVSLAAFSHAYAAPAAVASPDPASWAWPSSAADPAVRKSIIEGRYTVEELKNLRTMLDFLSTRDRGASSVQWYAPGYKSKGRGFRGLEQFFGSNGYASSGIPDREDHIEYIMAKDDRVWVTWFIEGHHNGLLFGFPGTGKLVKIRETAIVRLRDGMIVEADFLGDDLALYTQVGGRLQFPPH